MGTSLVHHAYIVLQLLASAACGLAFLLFPNVSSSQSSKQPDKPNIILIMADDLGWGDVGFNGNQIIKTPHLDKIAATGIVFDRFYAAAPVCSPTRASALTGRNPYRQGIYTANVGHLKKEERTLAEILKQNGYRTGMFGKWHLGTLTTKIKDANRGLPGDTTHYAPPSEHGFDRYFVTESKVPTFDPMIAPRQFDSINGESLRYGWKASNPDSLGIYYGTRYWEGKEKSVSTEKLKGENTALIIDRTIEFIKEAYKNKQPFFTVIWIHTPHLPVVSDLEFRKKYPNEILQKQLYFGSISAMDTQVGRLYDYLKSEKIENNTMIWFASDNGPELRTPGTAGKFKGKKRDLYEGGIRVPAFVSWPDKFKENKRITLPVVTSDYLPTIVEFLQLKTEQLPYLDGMNIFVPITNKNESRNRAIGFQYPNRLAWVTDDYKLIKNGKTKLFELYSLKTDPYEKNNIILQEPEIANKLRSDLMRWVESCKQSALGSDYK